MPNSRPFQVTVIPRLSKHAGDGRSLSCPTCSSTKIDRTDTRHHRGTKRRRYHCQRCEYRFFTAEYECDVDCVLMEDNVLLAPAPLE